MTRTSTLRRPLTADPAGARWRRPAGSGAPSGDRLDDGPGRRPAARRRWTSPTLATAVAAVLVAVAFVIGSRPIGDNSALTHLATGRWMLDHGSVPDRDLYSFTAAGQPWLVQSWLASGLYGALERLGGLEAVRVLNGLLTAAVAVLAWSSTARIRSVLVRVALLAPVLGIGTALWPPRPLLFGLVGVALVLRVLDGRLSPRWLVAVFALWGATHGSYPIGLALLAVTAVGTWLDDRRTPTTELRALGWASLGLASIPLGPLGIDGLLFPVRLLLHNPSVAEVVEWQPPSWSRPSEWFFAALVAAVAITFVRYGVRWRQALPSVVAVGLGLLAVRNLSLASLVLVAAMAPALASTGRSRLSGTDRGPLAVALVATASLLVAVALSDAVQREPLALDAYPVAEVAELRSRGLVGDPGVRLITHDVVGGYLELVLGPRANVFVDDRVDLFETEVVRDYVDLLGGDDHGPVLDRWDADVVLWEAEGELRRRLDADQGWDLVHDGDRWVVFCRADSPVRSRC